MKDDPLKLYAKLRQQLTDEKAQLEARLGEISVVLKPERANLPLSSLDKIATDNLESDLAPAARRGRKPSAGNTISLREAVMKALSNGPLARKDLAKAVENVGFHFSTSNPLNSIGAVLYSENSPVKSKGGKYYLPDGAKIAGGSSNGNGAQSENSPPTKKQRKISPEGRARIAAAARARWAKQRAGK